MSKTKKIISALLCACIILSIGLLTACTSQTDSTAKGETGKLSIVCTIFPEYDWVKQILGDSFDDVELTLLLDSGVDLHSYQPTADDIIKISTCDMFIYVGGESDEWVDDALKNAANKNMTVINLIDILGSSVKQEEIVEGMEEEEDEEEHEEEQEYDEHVWLSLNNAEILCREIAQKLSSLDSGNSTQYINNVNSYIEKLSNLDNQYREVTDNANKKTLLFGDRFPFRYLVDDYSLAYYAAFAGCSAETEASFKTVSYLADKVDELGLHAVMTVDGTNNSLARTIIDNTSSKDQKILSLNSMQATTSVDIENGATYISIMQSNLSVLKEALE